MIVFKGTSSPKSSSGCVTTNWTIGFPTNSFGGRKAGLVDSALPEILTSVLFVWDFMGNFDDILARTGYNVGMQAVIMPLEHSITLQVHALPSVQDLSEASNAKRVAKR